MMRKQKFNFKRESLIFLSLLILILSGVMLLACSRDGAQRFSIIIPDGVMVLNHTTQSTLESGDIVKDGQMLVIRYNIPEEYEMEALRVNGNNFTSGGGFIVRRDVLIEFSYRRKPCLESEEIFHVTYGWGIGGIIEGYLNQWILHGENALPVVAIPSEGYRFDRWTDGVLTAKRQEIGVTMPVQAHALFYAIPRYEVIHQAGWGGMIDGYNITVCGTIRAMRSTFSMQRIEFGKNANPVTAIAGAWFRFVGWSDGVLSETRHDTNIAESLRVYAEFVPYYSVAFFARGAGVIQGNNSQLVSLGESASPVTAIANTGFRFTSWSDGVLTATRHDTNISGHIFVTAEFEQRVYSVAIMAGQGGRLERDEEVVNIRKDRIYYGTNLGIITAIPDSEFRFLKWSDTDCTNPVRDITHIDGNIYATAIFERILQFTRMAYGYNVRAVPNTATIIEIPAMHNGLRVIEISSSGFASSPLENCVLEVIIIPHTIARVNSGSFFSANSLRRVHFKTGRDENGNKTGVQFIGQMAFGNTPNLDFIIIPSTVTPGNINPMAFWNNVSTRITRVIYRGTGELNLNFEAGGTNISGAIAVTDPYGIVYRKEISEYGTKVVIESFQEIADISNIRIGYDWLFADKIIIMPYAFYNVRANRIYFAKEIIESQIKVYLFEQAFSGSLVNEIILDNLMLV